MNDSSVNLSLSVDLNLPPSVYLHVEFSERCVRKRMKAVWLILLVLLLICLPGTGYGGGTEHTDENHRSFDIPK